MRVFFIYIYTGLLMAGLLTTPVMARDVVFCTHYGFEPYVIKQGKKLRGIDIDIIIKALKNERMSSQIKAYPWARLISELEEGRCDFGFSLFDTEERRKFAEYLFTVPIHYSTFSVFVKKEKAFTFERVSDFFGKTIAHNRGFSLTVGLEQAISDGMIKRVNFDNVENAMEMLIRDRIDLIIGNDARFRYHIKQAKKSDDIIALNLPFLPHHPAFLVLSKKSDLKNAQEIKSRLQRQLRDMHLDGSIMDITTHYLN